MDLTQTQLCKLADEADKHPYTLQRRRTLLAVADVALRARGHTEASRARLKRFRAALTEEDNNDEIEVVSEALIEAVMHAMDGLRGRDF